MNYAPIIVFAYDRPDHLSQTLGALAKNDLAKESVLYVYCDGPREWVSEGVRELANKRVRGGNYITKRYGKMHCTKEE